MYLNLGKVEALDDISGNDNFCEQLTTSNQPLFDPVGINGFPAMNFTGGTQRLVGTVELTAGGDLYVMAAQGAVAPNNRLFGVGVVGQNDYDNLAYAAWLYSALPGVMGTYRNGAYGNLSVVPFAPTIMNSGFDGTNGTNRINGDATSIYSYTTNFNTQNYAIGNQLEPIGDNQPWVGYIGEIIVCNIKLDLLTRQKMEGYLAHKWLTTGSLPVSHPYKTSPPTI